jgi:hypothetical protein
MFHKQLLSLILPGLALAGLVACSNPLEDDEHGEAVGVDVTDMEGAPIANYRTSRGSWEFTSSDALQLVSGEIKEVKIFFVTADGDRFQEPATGSDHTHRVTIEHANVASYEGEVDHGEFEGLSAGETNATIQLYHGSHADFETNPGMPITVTNMP